MAYQCKDCSYKAAKQFPNGHCPACGSYNVSSVKGIIKKSDYKESKTKVEIVTLVLFWGVLAWGIWDRYFNK